MNLKLNGGGRLLELFCFWETRFFHPDFFEPDKLVIHTDFFAFFIPFSEQGSRSVNLIEGAKDVRKVIVHKINLSRTMF